MLQSLCDDLDDENMVFKIINDNNAECKQKMFDVSRRRPDGQFRKKTERDNLITIRYIASKVKSERKNHAACMQGLVRLGIFGKNAIDIYRLKGMLLIQAIGQIHLPNEYKPNSPLSFVT